jgi:arginase
MTVLAVPYHLDEELPALELPLPADRTVTAALPDGTPWERMATVYDRVAKEVAAAPADGGAPLVISGDCTTSLGVVAGLQRSGLAPSIVWFDAHGDVHTPDTTTSGYLGGMPLRMLVGEGDETVAKHTGLRAVSAADVLLVGARDLDPPEETYLETAAIRRCRVAEVTGDLLPPGPLYVHLDLDVVDPDDLPGLLYPAAGGPALDEVGDAVRAVLSTGRVAALGVACTWHPGSAAATVVGPLLAQFLAAL